MIPLLYQLSYTASKTGIVVTRTSAVKAPPGWLTPPIPPPYTHSLLNFGPASRAHRRLQGDLQTTCLENS